MRISGSEERERSESELGAQTSSEIRSLLELKAAAKQALEKCMCSSTITRRYNVIL